MARRASVVACCHRLVVHGLTRAAVPLMWIAKVYKSRHGNPPATVWTLERSLLCSVLRSIGLGQQETPDK
jgi:hypothetical protein